MTGEEVWRGGVNTWECDEMGHMNVRFHLTRAHEGLGGLARRLDLPDAFRAGAPSTLVVREQHIRFLREAHAGAPLSMTGAVVRLGETDADLVLMLLHADGAPASTFRLRVEHVTHDGRVFPWPARVRRAADALTIEPPVAATPRSLAFADGVAATASLEGADRMGLTCIGRGVLQPTGCDAQGFMRPDEFMGRVSDGAGALMRPVRDAAATGAPADARVGGAVLEYRLLFLDRPRAGDHLELRSGLCAVEAKTTRVVHWMLDPVSGRPWVSSEAVVVSFDLDARKALAMPPEAQAALRAKVAPGLGL